VRSAFEVAKGTNAFWYFERRLCLLGFENPVYTLVVE
jgi:hypothetical protein